jgi:hypothetical protein
MRWDSYSKLRSWFRIRCFNGEKVLEGRAVVNIGNTGLRLLKCVSRDQQGELLREMKGGVKILVINYTQNTWLIPQSRVILEKLTVAQLIKKFPTFYGIQRFITVFTRARHWSLSWARRIHSASSHPFKIHFTQVFKVVFVNKRSEHIVLMGSPFLTMLLMINSDHVSFKILPDYGLKCLYMTSKFLWTSHDTSADKVNGYKRDDRLSIPGMTKIFHLSPLWDRL